MPRTIETLPTPLEACSRILALAEPGEPIEVSLIDAIGLVLAEPAIADVDLPPFDRAASEGYAVRASETTPGALLRVARLRWSNRTHDEGLETGEAIRLDVGDPLPVGADAVIRLEDVRPDPETETGPPRVVEVLRSVEPARDVARRGNLLEAGSILAPAGTRLKAPMVGLLAAQGCVHPVCHRRVRVAVVAVGDHLVGPADAPVMHRERNAANAAILALTLRAGAMTHDLQAVAPSEFPDTFDRALTAPVIVVLAPTTRSVLRTFKSFGVETIVPGLAMKPGGRSRHYVIRDESGQVAHHVFHLPLAPVAASTAFAILVDPLIGRLQGGPVVGPRTVAAVWEGAHRASVDRLRAVPVTLEFDAEARQRARPAPLRGTDDLAGFAKADGLALLNARSGPWLAGEVVEVLPLG